MQNNTGAGIYEELSSFFQTAAMQITKEVKLVTKRHARQCRENIKNDSPINTTYDGKTEHGVYKNGWRVSTEESTFGIECVVHQYRRPSLTWLLENGHMLKDGSRTKAQPHINKNAEEELESWYNELCEIDFAAGISKW